MTIVDDLVEAREAFERREWATAQQQLSAVDQKHLSPDDLLRLGLAAYLVGDRTACVGALQDAYQAALDIDEPLGAARIAFWLGLSFMTGGDAAVAGGWVARAQRLLADHHGDAVEHGYILILQLLQHLARGDFPGAVEAAPRITDYGQRFDDPDLIVMGRSSEGRLLLYAGRVPEGLALLDQAMSSLTTSSVSPIIAGTAYCTMIEGCQEIADFARVADWTRSLTAWCATQPDLVHFTGQCAVHRAQVMRAAGHLSAALTELELALRRYSEAGQASAVGMALAEQGDILRLQRAYDAAERAYARASGYGHDPQPGLALLWMATGRRPAAVSAVRRLLQEAAHPVARARILPAAVEILLVDGDQKAAHTAAVELVRIADDFGCAAQSAAADFATGCVQLASGNAAGAVSAFRQALRRWSGLGTPYEAARARVMIGRTYRQMGDENSAKAEWTEAKDAFAALGALDGVREVERLQANNLPDNITPREADVLRLVAAGKSNAAIAVALVLSEKTVARHISNIFVKIEVSSRTAAAAYAFEHGLA